MQDFDTRRILITVRAAPEPSKKYNETSCVAGVDLDNEVPVRIFPVPARSLKDSNRFKKWSIFQASFRKASKDKRPESFNIDTDSIQVLDHIDTGPRASWSRRHEMIQPFRISDSLEVLRARYDTEKLHGTPSLALIRPNSITRFCIEYKERDEWNEDELAKLNQMNFFDISNQSRKSLEFIPYDFYYEFRCGDPQCRGHRCKVLDWELIESYRQWRVKYGDRWEWAIRNKYEYELVTKKDLPFFMGTALAHPKSWMIIGLYYPGKRL